jgi:DNA-binding SARP family transcriptional activator
MGDAMMADSMSGSFGAQPVRQDDAGEPFELALFDNCTLWKGRRAVPLKSREQRLVALLGLEGSRSRGYIAGMLWAEATEAHAAGSLRATVWQLDRTAPGLLCHGNGQLGLDPVVGVDVRRFKLHAHRIIAMAQQDAVEGLAEKAADSLSVLLSGELLAGWYEDWALLERERLQQLRICALEVLAELMMDCGQVITALTAALAATAIEPLRESAQRAVIRIHMANGNYHAALRQYLTFRSQLQRELGIGPSVQMERLVGPLRARAASVAERVPVVG